MNASSTLTYSLIGLAISLVGTVAAAQTLPRIKAGLWETTMTTVDGAKKTQAVFSTQCFDNSVLEQMFKMGSSMMGASCTKNTVQITGNKVSGYSECKMAGSVVTSTTETTFESDVSYRTESKSTFSPPLYGSKENSTVAQVKHLGACKPGMKLGDVTTGPVTVNLLDMANSMKAKK